MVITIPHGLKIVTFGLLSFIYGRYVALLVRLVTFSFIGGYVGKLLLKLPGPIFRVALKATLTVLALQLLYSTLRAAIRSDS